MCSDIEAIFQYSDFSVLGTLVLQLVVCLKRFCDSENCISIIISFSAFYLSHLTNQKKSKRQKNLGHFYDDKLYDNRSE